MKSTQHKDRSGFFRKGITIPKELAPFVEDRAGQPEHAGNLSSYIRNLIIQDRERLDRLEKKAA